MSDPVRTFYDDLADSYHLIFQDWTQSIEFQAGILGPLIEREMPEGRLRILDCACGVGTQALGLAARGHVLTGADLSAAAVDRARREAQDRSLPIRFEVADMRDLSAVRESGFDVVLAADNALPHLPSDEDLTRAIQQIAGKLRGNGLFLASIRDYDQILERHPAMPPPVFFRDGARRRIYHQVWDWIDDRQYVVHVYITQEEDAGWKCRHFVSVYRGILRQELTDILHRTGFVDVRWLMPPDSGYYQPLVLGRCVTAARAVRF